MDNIVQVGERLRGLREVLDIAAEEMAEMCDVSLEQYRKIEAGEADPAISRLAMISKRYDISLDELLFGEEPKMSKYFITRKGQGQTVERSKSYSYESLGNGFRGRRMDPFLTTVDPLPDGARHPENSHDGQEFEYIVEGRLEITVGKKVMTLNPGDSIYFDATEPHSLKALDGAPCKFLAIVI